MCKAIVEYRFISGKGLENGGHYITILGSELCYCDHKVYDTEAIAWEEAFLWLAERKK